MLMISVVVATHPERPISPEAVRQLYTAVQWWPDRSVTTIAAVLETSIAIGAWYGDELVGFSRAVTDGHFRAYIEDVAVLQAYRRDGIGEKMLLLLLEKLHHIETISLFCEHKIVPWYERVGFAARGSQIVMHRRRQTP